MTVHTASYTLELGQWHATCRVCGWKVIDRDRRRAAGQYRHHIRAAAESETNDQVAEIDLRDCPGERVHHDVTTTSGFSKMLRSE